MKKQKEDQNHHMGKSTGYELIDGVYHIAPVYSIAFDKLADRAQGIDQLVRSVTIHAAEITRDIASERREIWNRVLEDLGLDETKMWRFSNGTIFEEKGTSPPKQA